MLRIGYILIMILTRKLQLRLSTKATRMNELFINQSNKVYYDIPTQNLAKRFHYKINEEVPKDAVDFPLNNISLEHQNDTPDFDKVPKLCHGLNKLLDGKFYMGDQGFGKIPRLGKEVTSQMSVYKPPSEDKQLLELTKQYQCKYTSSTSNISIPMMHLYFLFSMFRRPNFDNVYEESDYDSIKKEYMNHFKKPSTFFLTKKERNGKQVFSIDSDKGYSEEKENQILLQVGTLSQYLLTHSAQVNKAIVQTKTVTQIPENYYRYCVVNNNLFLRSQIDCRDIDQNGNPFVFQIKTRACAPIRYDVENWQLYKDYPINKLRGVYQSFQREYYDLIRGAFIKYAFQLKIGRMDGAFVMYHNTEDVYGYEYVKFKQIVLRLFGNQYNLDVSFGIISKMMTSIFDYILEDTKEYNYQRLKIGFYANSATKSINVLVEVMSELKEYPSIQSSESVAKYFEEHIKQFKNPVLKYDVSFFTFLNGILVRYPQIYYNKSDNIKMKWKMRRFGRIQKEEYLHFLREAYKEDYVFGANRYYGSWPELQEIKEWN